MKKIINTAALIFMLFYGASAQLQIQWSATYNYTNAQATDQPFDMALDSSGNTFVLAQSMSNNSDVALISYNSSGTQRWVNRYNNNQDDYPSHIVIDKNSNSYITCTTWATSAYETRLIKYNFNGTLLWQKTIATTLYNTDIFPVLSGAFIYVATTTYDFTLNPKVIVAKYDTSGYLNWKRLYQTKTFASGAVVDPNGILYVCGGRDTSSHSNFLLMKYDSSGIFKWQRTINPSTIISCPNFAESILMDNNYGIYMAGVTCGQQADDIALVKYDTAGAFKWQKIYNDSLNYKDDFFNMHYDGNANIYIAADHNHAANNSNFDFDPVVLKYDTTGSLTWRISYLTTYPFLGPARDVVLHGQNEVYMLCDHIFRFDTSKNFYWDFNPNNSVQTVCLDSIDNIYTTGVNYNGNNVDVLTIKYSQLTAINDLSNEANQINCFPNPTEGMIHIQFSMIPKNGVVKIYDSLGKLVAEQKITEPETKIDMSSLTTGIYIMKINTDKSSFTRKIVKL